MELSRSFKPFALSLSILAALSGCVYDPYYHGPTHQPSYFPYYYPFYYDYYFYPSAHVYFNFSTGFYYYPSGKSWKRSKVLPPHIHLDSRERVTTRIEGDKPYLKNKQHIQQFQPRRNYGPDPQINRKEQRRNLKSYEQHQQKQKVYKKEWESRKKKDRKPQRK